MKAKKFEKKLGLSKRTVANLGDTEMGQAKGGASAYCTLPDCEPESEGGPYICPSVLPYSTCYPLCCSNDPGCVWPLHTDIC